MIAFPADLQESSVLSALDLVHIDDVVGATSVRVPISNFSQIVAVSFQNAMQRVLPDDPRRTPFMDQLQLRFSMRGPDETPWTVMYIPEPSRTRDAVTARVLTGLSNDWAWDGTESTGSSRWLLLPSLIWSIWLVTRNSRSERLERLLWVIACLPMLYGAGPGSSILFIVLTGAGTLASRFVHSGGGSRLPFMLWPYSLATIALLLYEPDSLLKMAVSIVLALVTARLKPRIEQLARRRRLHMPPEFRNLTMIGVQGYARRLNQVVLVTVAVIITMTALVPAREGVPVAYAPRFTIERSVGREHPSPNALYEEHIGFQRAITYGRLGDFSLGNTSYDLAYRYREEGGRMMRMTDTQETMSDWPASSFRAAMKVLLEDKPGLIRLKQ